MASRAPKGTGDQFFWWNTLCIGHRFGSGNAAQSLLSSAARAAVHSWQMGVNDRLPCHERSRRQRDGSRMSHITAVMRKKVRPEMHLRRTRLTTSTARGKA